MSNTAAGESLQPMFDRVLLRRAVSEKVGSIFVPSNVAKQMSGRRCEVIAIGPACESGLVPGDEVIITEHGGAWISPSGKGAARVDVETFIISETDILAKVSK